MTAFIKFCGGCNTKYDRGAVAGMLKQVFSKDVEFVSHDVKKPCNIGIIISGCDTECVKEKDLAPADLYIRINSMNDLDAAIRKIKSHIA